MKKGANPNYRFMSGGEGVTTDSATGNVSKRRCKTFSPGYEPGKFIETKYMDPTCHRKPE
jgi:hypothetical protein